MFRACRLVADTGLHAMQYVHKLYAGFPRALEILDLKKNSGPGMSWKLRLWSLKVPEFSCCSNFTIFHSTDFVTVGY